MYNINIITKNGMCQFRTIFKFCRLQNFRFASTYDGDGKTFAQVLNKDVDCLMVSGYSSLGFRLNNGIRLIGPVIVFPRTFISWNVSGIGCVHAKSLSIFNMLCPKIDIIVLGYGDANTLPRDVELEILKFSQSNNIGIEILPTEKAVATFNYLNYEKRFCAGAFIPPIKVQIYDDAEYNTQTIRQKVLDES